MATPTTAHLVARRNAPLAFEWPAFTDEAGAPVDFTGATLAMQVRQYGAQAGEPLVDLGAPSVSDEGVSASGGVLSVYLDQAPLNVLPRKGNGQNDVFRYDLLVTLSGGVAEVWAQGDFTVKPGVTDRLGLRITDTGDYRVTDDGAYRVTG